MLIIHCKSHKLDVSTTSFFWRPESIRNFYLGLAKTQKYKIDTLDWPVPLINIKIRGFYGYIRSARSRSPPPDTL